MRLACGSDGPIVTAESLAAALDLIRTGRADARAAPRPVLIAESAQLPGARVLEDGFATMAYVFNSDEADDCSEICTQSYRNFTCLPGPDIELTVTHERASPFRHCAFGACRRHA